MPESSVSANSLFHFTSSLERLTGILRDYFRPGYVLENHTMFLDADDPLRPSMERAIPMVSFSDIPLAQIWQHKDTYGHYALGLSKDWGARAGINPVFYMSEESYVVWSIREIIRAVCGRPALASAHPDYQSLVDYVERLIFFTKPYQGRTWRDGEYEERSTRFYDEREWRYVPTFDHIRAAGLPVSIRREDFLGPRGEELSARMRSEFRLMYQPADVRYIIVDKESELPEMLKVLDEAWHLGRRGDRESLKTRLMSMERMSEDY